MRVITVLAICVALITLEVNASPSKKELYEEGIKNLLVPYCGSDGNCESLVLFASLLCATPSEAAICQSDCKFVLSYLWEKYFTNRAPEAGQLRQFVPDQCTPSSGNRKKLRLKGSNGRIPKKRFDDVDESIEDDGPIPKKRFDDVGESIEDNGPIPKKRFDDVDESSEENGRIPKKRFDDVDESIEDNGPIPNKRFDDVDESSEENGRIPKKRFNDVGESIEENDDDDEEFSPVAYEGYEHNMVHLRFNFDHDEGIHEAVAILKSVAQYDSSVSCVASDGSNLKPGQIHERPCQEVFPFQTGNILGLCLDSGYLYYSNVKCDVNFD